MAELPTLESGLTLVECDGTAGYVPLQALAIDHLLLEGGDALWIGPGRDCRTESMRELAPDRRVLERIHLARGFTPYQHTALLRTLEDHLTDRTAVIVLPEVDRRYREDVQGSDGQTMLLRALAVVHEVARTHDVPVLCTVTDQDGLAEPVIAGADQTLSYAETPMGPRFTGADYETLVYDIGDGWVQTTLAFWAEVLQTREPLYPTPTASTEVTASGAH